MILAVRCGEREMYHRLGEVRSNEQVCRGEEKVSV
jgi:hypothetical protein